MMFRLFLACFIASLACSETFEDIAAQATAARNANEIPRAIRLYRQAVALNPHWDEGWWFLGSLLYDSDRYADARDALARFVQLDPDAAPGLALLGLSEFETHEYPAALNDIQSALAAIKEDQPALEPVLRFHEAMLLARRGDFDGAVRKYVWFAHLDSPDPSLLEAIGLAALRIPRLPAEAGAGERDLHIEAGKAAFLTMAGQQEEAGQKLRQLAADYPYAHGVHYLYGCFLLATLPQHAVGELKRELQIDPANSAAATMLAWVLLNMHEADAALPLARQAAGAEPGVSRAQFVLGRALAETGDAAAGLEHLELAAKLDPGDLETHLALAGALSQTGSTVRARAERLTCVELSRRTAAGAH